MKKRNNINNFIRSAITLLVITSILISCKKDPVEKEKNFSYLIDWQLIDNVSKTSIQFFASTIPDVNAAISSKELQNVNIYKITYKTKMLMGQKLQLQVRFYFLKEEASFR
jgi:hypothetical protein